MAFAIETERLTGGYGITVVLHSLSLRVPRGTIFGFLGPNGAGKTTAIRLFLGLLPPISGEIRLFDQPLAGALPAILSRVGSLIEQPSLYDHLTGRENLEIIRRLKGLERRDADNVIAALEMSDYAAALVREYSRGMRQRLGIAIALLGRPELVLLDEPMNGLDAGGLAAFRSAIQRMCEEFGTTFLVSSHQLDELDLIATHVGILNSEGDLVFQGTRQELSKRVPQELRLRVDRPRDAVTALAANGYEVSERGGDLVLYGATQEDALRVNQLLVASGVGVYHLSIELATLEQLYIEVAGTAK